MDRRLLILAAVAGGAWLAYHHGRQQGQDEGTIKIPLPVIRPTPVPIPVPQPRPSPSPWGERGASVEATVGGPKLPDGGELQCDLPGEMHSKNISSRGLGCCVFRSIDHAARLQNIPALQKMPEWMVSKGIEGGGYPSKASKLIAQLCKERGVPEVPYLQVEHADYDLLRRGLATGRMACVTYSRSPTGRYGGGRIAHMVNAVHADDKVCAILDNNYIGERNYEFLTPEEVKKAGCLEWILFLLPPGPPPPPSSSP